MIYPRNGALYIQDRSSMNGTWLNGERVSSPTRLRSGDELELGTTEMMFF
jgi:pSer/pThr/pTyr-binding forkhead associated (FHA) protein